MFFELLRTVGKLAAGGNWGAGNPVDAVSVLLSIGQSAGNPVLHRNLFGSSPNDILRIRTNTGATTESYDLPPVEMSRRMESQASLTESPKVIVEWLKMTSPCLLKTPILL